jgi:hypothetical protein
MKISELVHDKKYRIKGQSGIVFYKHQEGKRFWFTNISGSFWMNENQIETLLINP